MIGGFGPQLQPGPEPVYLAILLTLAACQGAPPQALGSIPWSVAGRQALAYPAFLVQPQTADRYRQQGLNYRQRGDLERALATLTIAAALDPGNPDGYIILGWTQHLAGQRPAAISSLHRALDQAPDSVPALNALGIVYLVAGDLTAAVSTHNRALALQPDNEIAHYNLCLAHHRQGQWDQAIHHGQRATQLEPANPHPWLDIALAYSAAGDGTKARASNDQALAQDGGYGQRSYLDHLEQAGFSGEQIGAIAALVP